MNRLRKMITVLSLALPLGCMNGGTGRQNASLRSCFDTGNGVECEGTPDGVDTQAHDVDGDGDDDPFVCADADSGSDDSGGDDTSGDSDSDSAGDATDGDDSDGDNSDGDANDADSDGDSDSDNDGVDDDVDCDDTVVPPAADPATGG